MRAAVDVGEQERLLRAALMAADRGWYVFPLRPDDKRPAIRDWQVRATTNTHKIAMCWRMGPYNIGIACGPSELVVVDLDLPKVVSTSGAAPVDGRAAFVRLARDNGATDWWHTFTVATISGGRHLYYRAPDATLRNTAGRLAPLIDTRAEGGYVVAPGSVVNGRLYTVARDDVVAPLPLTLEQRLRSVPARAPSPAIDTPRSPSRYADAAIRGETTRVEAAAPGTRNHTLNAAAFSLGRLVGAGLVPADSVEAALQRAARSAGLDEHEIAATIRSGLTAGTQCPREVPAPSPLPVRRSHHQI